MNIQTIKTVDGQEFVLLPLNCYKGLKSQIDEYLAYEEEEDGDEYVPFVLEDYISNPVALARINAGVTQKELAKLLKVSQAYISKLESSKRVSAKVMLNVNQALKNE
jgi:ribosome-binding protein aMBF1 (putative translation factor)